MIERLALRWGSLLFALALFVSGAVAQDHGYELELRGSPRARLGEPLHLAGTAYAVEGLATLRALPNGQIVAKIVDWRAADRQTSVVAETTVRADANGRFVLEIAVPSPREAIVARELVITVGRAGEPGRELRFSLEVDSGFILDVLSDRDLYEPEETVHVLARLTRASSGAPAAGQNVQIQVSGPDGRLVASREGRTSAGGTIATDFALPSSAMHGAYSASVVMSQGGVAVVSRAKTFAVGRRTVERLLVAITLDSHVIGPGGTLVGHVRATSPSGTPVRGATVEVDADDAPASSTTDENGDAAFRVRTSVYMAREIDERWLDVRVTHPAYGTLHEREAYLVSRVDYRVELVARSHALVPETDTAIFVSVSTPHGEPAPAGTPVVVRGAAIRGGSATLAVDEFGFAEVPARLAAGAAAPLPSLGCSGMATPVDVTVGERGRIARLCVPVSTEAEVAIHAESSIVAPGSPVTVVVDRRPMARAKDVIVEALAEGRAIAAAFADARTNRVELTLPAHVSGRIVLRARALSPANARASMQESGAASAGIGSSAAVLARPEDAFTLAISPTRDMYSVREQAEVTLETTPARPGFAAIVVRDLAAHGGESPFTRRWITTLEERRAFEPGNPAAELVLRAGLAASLTPDESPERAPPLVPAPWQPHVSGNARTRGELRDPISLREQLMRFRVGVMMQRLESLVASTSASTRTGFLRETNGRVDFAEDAMATLVTNGTFSREEATTLGGTPITIAMLREADPSFTFDNVARRVTRARLLQWLIALLRFTNTDDPSATLWASTEPPERWLARIIQLGVLPQEQLLDAWGHPLVFHETAQPEIVVSERAPRFELASAGPDGRIGTSDDLRNPLDRVIPAGTPYAVASGEDTFMRQVSALAIAGQVLQSMATAFATLGLAALEEQRGNAVAANASESMDDAEQDRRVAAGEFEIGSLSMQGMGSGSGGSGYGYGRGGAASRSAAPSVNAPAPPPPLPSGRTTALAGVVRERFPATLLFVPEAALDASGHTAVAVPLADAVTTYRVEAIAWTASGWITSAQTEIHVDQPAKVDAPVPPFATVGDVLRLPIRLENRTDAPLEALVSLAAEGLPIEAAQPRRVRVPPHEAIEENVELRVTSPGQGSILVRATRPSGEALDAVRRPLVVHADTRLVRASLEQVIVSSGSIAVDVPEGSVARGDAEIRVAVGPSIFTTDAGEQPDLYRGFADVVAGAEVRHEDRELALRTLGADRPVDEPLYVGPLDAALAVSVAFGARELDDAILERALRMVTSVLGDPNVATRPGEPSSDASVLLALGPAYRARASRARLRASLEAVVTRLRTQVSSRAAAAAERPDVWVESAAALALTAQGNDTRARELLRRAGRARVDVGDEAWIEASDDTTAYVAPTALYALARALLGQRADALLFVRRLVRAVGEQAPFGPRERGLARAAAALLGSSATRGVPRVTLDGDAVRLTSEGAVTRATVAGLGAPGHHAIEVTLPEGGVAIVHVDLRYGAPWTGDANVPAGLELAIRGEIGARDTRSGLYLEVRNRGPRMLSRPMIEIALPAGAELDEGTRGALGTGTMGRPVIEERVMTLALRPLPPGGSVRVPIPVRWSIAGALRGLGAVAFDASVRPVRPLAIQPSRVIEIPAHGEEPDEVTPDTSRPPPVLPDPPPIVPLRPLASADHVAAAKGGVR